MTVQPGVGYEPLEMPDIVKGVIDQLKWYTNAFASAPVFASRWPLDPATQVPLVVVTLPPGGGQLNHHQVQARVEVQVWGESRVGALALADMCRRALVRRGGFRLDERGVATRVTANPTPHRVDSGEPANRVPSYLAGYDLIIRMTHVPPE